MKDMQAMKGREKAAISLLQDLHGKNTTVYFYFTPSMAYYTPFLA
jgi:hypothetical protein